MATDYKLILKTPAGAKLGEIYGPAGGGGTPARASFLSLGYSKQVNEPGLLRFGLPADHDAIALLSHNSQIEVWRRDVTTSPVIPWYCDFYGLLRGQGYTYSDRELWEATCPGQMSMLGWRRVLYPAETASRSQFTSTAAETIMKTMVEYNAGASATVANGRKRAGALATSGFTVTCASDTGAGNSLSWFCAWDNLLESLQKMAGLDGPAGGDFDLVRTGAAAWEFRWYTGQLGTDRRATVTFAPGLGNMGDVRYTHDRVNEKTVCVVGGQNTAAARTTVTRTGSDYAAASNDVETFIDATDVTTTAGLNARGDAKLNETRARREFAFKVLQTPRSLYGREYFLGDLATAYYRSTTATIKIAGVNVALSTSGSGETIDVETRTVTA